MFQVGQAVFCYYGGALVKGTVIESEPECNHDYVRVHWGEGGVSFFPIEKVFSSLEEWQKYSASEDEKSASEQAKALENIALEMLGIETLEVRHKVELDVHSLHVGSIKMALKKAFELGQGKE